MAAIVELQGRPPLAGLAAVAAAVALQFCIYQRLLYPPRLQ